MVEKTKYAVLSKIDEVEIREYPALLVASVQNKDDNTAFGLLFNYISGNNESRKKIPMTSPVISSEKIPMTSPVISKNGYFAFILPQQYTKNSAPKPNNTAVTIEVIPKKIIATLRFSGKTTIHNISQHEHLLKTKLNKEEISTRGDSFLMRYNSPFTPGFLRRNEIAIELTKFSK
jgi:hypothetical protein